MSADRCDLADGQCNCPCAGCTVSTLEGEKEAMMQVHRLHVRAQDARIAELTRELGRHTSGTQIEGDYVDALQLAEAELAAERARTDALTIAVRECASDWREQASAEEHCQRSGGNPKGALAYRHCADDIEQTLTETIKPLPCVKVKRALETLNEKSWPYDCECYRALSTVKDGAYFGPCEDGRNHKMLCPVAARGEAKTRAPAPASPEDRQPK